MRTRSTPAISLLRRVGPRMPPSATCRPTWSAATSTAPAGRQQPTAQQDQPSNNQQRRQPITARPPRHATAVLRRRCPWLLLFGLCTAGVRLAADQGRINRPRGGDRRPYSPWWRRSSWLALGSCGMAVVPRSVLVEVEQVAAAVPRPARPARPQPVGGLAQGAPWPCSRCAATHWRRGFGRGDRCPYRPRPLGE
jgi:hypothetical protein